MPSLTLRPNGAAASSHSRVAPSAANSHPATTPAGERPFKISIVFDEAVSARSAETLIKHLASDFKYELQEFAFDELDPPGPGVTAARSAADTDILVVAVRDDQVLPEHVQLWLGLCFGLRDVDQEGLLIVLIVKPEETAEPDSSLLDYLKTVAAVGGMTFFSPQRSARRGAISNHTWLN